MAIKTLLDCCTSFHSFKTDKKKFQVGHVTPKHQAMNKPSPHTAVGARPACPPWQGWLLPLTWEIISQLQQILFSLGGCTGEPDRTGSSALPGPAGSWSTGRSRVPLQRSSWRGCRGSSVPALALCPCPGSAQLPGLCCLLPAPHSFPGTRGALPSCPQTLTQGFLLLCAVLSAFYPALPKARGESR